MKVAIYVSQTGRSLPCYGLLSPNRPVSLLPPGRTWTYVRSGDTAEFHLPEAVEQEIESRGFWAHTFGEGAPSHPAVAQAVEPRRGETVQGLRSKV